MNILLPQNTSYDELDNYFGDTQITFNGYYYDYSRKIYLSKLEQDYLLVPCKHSKRKLDVKSYIEGVYHYITDAYYKFITVFLTINGTYICNIPDAEPLSQYMYKCFCFFKSLPYSVKINLKEGDKYIFIDYTNIKSIS